MQHSIHQEKLAHIHWVVVIKVVLAVCAAVFVSFVVWYVASVMLPAYNRAQAERAFESAEVQFLVTRVGQIQTFIHFH
jgi:hypothetical protein